MSRIDGHGECESCGRSFPYQMVHNGFNDSAYAYCSECGQTALLDGWQIPKGLEIGIHGSVSVGDEWKLQPCPCGGRFMASASPRCPHCRQALSPLSAARWIEGNAPAAKAGWRWQGSWHGLYAIVISDRVVHNNWQDPRCAI
jgi:hypothetical protein